MPIYEYECSNCHQQFDLLQKISDEPAKQCPQCLQDTAVKLVSAAAFQLKGSGWYATDFKNKPGESKKNESGSRSETTASTTTKSVEPSKPAATPAASNKGEKD